MSGAVESVMVLRVEDGMVVESFVFAGTDRDGQNRRAEEKFQKVLMENGCEADEAFSCTEDGYGEYAPNKSVQLHHSDETLIMPTSEIDEDDGTMKVMKDDIFIVTPGNADEDKIHQICKATCSGDLQEFIYPNDHYEVVESRMSLAAAKRRADVLGFGCPHII